MSRLISVNQKKNDVRNGVRNMSCLGAFPYLNLSSYSIKQPLSFSIQSNRINMNEESYKPEGRKVWQSLASGQQFHAKGRCRPPRE